jgi:hypothetical protein
MGSDRSVRLLLLRRALAGTFKINAPEVRRGSQKFHSDANALCTALPGKHNAALLLFLRLRIHQDQHFIIIHFMLQHQQAPVGVHHQGFTHLPKLLPCVAPAERLQLHSVKDALAAPICSEGGFLHSVPIIGLPSESVNCPFGQVFPIATLFCPATCKL